MRLIRSYRVAPHMERIWIAGTMVGDIQSYVDPDRGRKMYRAIPPLPVSGHLFTTDTRTNAIMYLIYQHDEQLPRATHPPIPTLPEVQQVVDQANRSIRDDLGHDSPEHILHWTGGLIQIHHANPGSSESTLELWVQLQGMGTVVWLHRTGDYTPGDDGLEEYNFDAAVAIASTLRSSAVDPNPESAPTVLSSPPPDQPHPHVIVFVAPPHTYGDTKN